MWRVLVVTFGVTFGLGFVPAQSDAQEANKVAIFMRAKLEHSQKVLEGLTLEDFDKIAKHGQEMSLLSQASTWQVLQTPEYHDRSVEFRRSVDAITEAARKKNLEGAALAYVDATMKCVSCHKYVRRVKMTRPKETTDEK